MFSGPQPLRLTFENWPEDKPETPGELPDPDKGGLGGARPLGMGVATGSPVLPHPPDHPPPPPPLITKKPSMPAPPPPPKLDQEVYTKMNRTYVHNMCLFIFFFQLISSLVIIMKSMQPLPFYNYSQLIKKIVKKEKDIYRQSSAELFFLFS